MYKFIFYVLFFISHQIYSFAKTTSSEIEIKFHKFNLKNGLTLIMHQDKKAPIIAVSVWYHVGSKDEKKNKTGFAHLFEHLMFSGSKNSNKHHFKIMDKIGATSINGTTSNDRTNYFETIPKSALDIALWAESDRMGYMLDVIDQKKLDIQIDVVKNEKKQRESVPYGKVWSIIANNTYPSNHPYSWTIIGSIQDLEKASLEDVHDWFKEYYGAKNTVITIAGDIEIEETRKKVERYFDYIKPGPPLLKYKKWVPVLHKTRIFNKNMNIFFL